MRGRCEGRVCFWGAGAAGTRSPVSLGPHRGQRPLFKHLAAKPAQGSVSVRVPQLGPSGGHARVLLCVCTQGARVPHQRSPQLLHTAGQCGGSFLVAAPCCVPRGPALSEALGEGWEAAGCPAARHWIWETCVTTWPLPPAPRREHVSSATGQRHRATYATVPSGGVLHGPGLRSPDVRDPGVCGAAGRALGAQGTAREL